MSEEKLILSKEETSELEHYGDAEVASGDAAVPKFLKLTYLFLPFWGILTFYYFWNGSLGWFDRGYWHELQIAANTTFPVENMTMVLETQELKEENEAPTQEVLR